MLKRVVAAVLAATFATACLSPEKCGNPQTPGWETCEGDRFEDAVVGTGITLGVLALVGLVGLAVNGAIEADEAKDAEAEAPSADDARDHAAAGRCHEALITHGKVRAKSPAAAKELERDKHVAACLATREARRRNLR